MAEKTEALIDACENAAKQITEEIRSAEGSIGSFNSTVKRIEDLGDDTDPKILAKAQESAVTSRTFFKGSLNRFEIFITRAEKAAKDLESKIKVKNVLDIFKTQKSLDAAKKTLSKTQEKIKTGKSDYAKFKSDYDDLDERVKEQSDRVTRLWKLKEKGDGGDSAKVKLLNDMEKFRTRTLMAGIKQVANVLGRSTPFATNFKKYQSEHKTRRSWKVSDRDKVVQEIAQDRKGCGNLTGELDALANTAKGEEKKLKMDPYKNDPEVKTLNKKVQTVYSQLENAMDKARRQVMAVDLDLEEINNDMALVALEDGDGQQNKAYQDQLAKAGDQMDFFAELMEHPGLDFDEFLGEFKEMLARFNVAIKTPQRVDEKGWNRIELDNETLRGQERQVDDLWSSVTRSVKKGSALANRFKNERAVQQKWKNFKDQMAAKQKKHDTWKKALPLVLAASEKAVAAKPE